ncbi:MAG TPA: type II secretion system F family protein [Mobilitalea sp.]|nr:type II secretion system F family protein [Mobilitalea sp.]
MIEDYNEYHFTLKEYMRYILQGEVIAVLIGWLFFRSIIGIIFLSPLVYWYCKDRRKNLVKKRKWQLNLEFRDGIGSLSAALGAGYSAEHAIEEALKDMALLYHKESIISREFTYLINQIKMNITVEKALSDFGERTGIEDIISFAEVFTTAKRTGGDLIHVIRNTSNTISDKIEVKREIITLITAKKYEANIMKIIPLGIICYMSLSSPGFLDPLYNNILGAAIMSVLLGIYLGTYLLIDKIVAIEI